MSRIYYRMNNGESVEFYDKIGIPHLETILLLSLQLRLGHQHNTDFYVYINMNTAKL